MINVYDNDDCKSRSIGGRNDGDCLEKKNKRVNFIKDSNNTQTDGHNAITQLVSAYLRIMMTHQIALVIVIN